MQFDEIDVKCPCCGRIVKRRIIRSSYRSDAGLDQKPESENLLPSVFECSECHYCTVDVKSPVDYVQQAFVRSDKYKSRMLEETEYPEERRIIAAMEFAEDRNVLAGLSMILCWRMEFRGAYEEARSVRMKAVTYQEEALKESAPDRDLVLQYLDNLRQLEHFDKGKSIIQEIKAETDLDERDLYTKILRFEEKLFNTHDKKQYMISDVMRLTDVVE